LTKSIALEGIPDNIRVNAVAPGPVERGHGSLSADERARLLEDHKAAGGSAISFAISPDAIASAVLFLASDRCTGRVGSRVR
jgi:NAD(P)-dependent dehydrogenase (short-subunit alcohol dehydrogenase family)